LEVEQMATFERNPASLSRRELRDFAQHLADEPERWAHLLDAEDEETRVYELIWDDGRVNAWVIRWSEDADTGYHDHDESAAPSSRVLHAGCGPALTIHAYSPPLRRTGAYSVGDGGELRRESQPFDVELTAEPALV
jgi:hypothetical protein